MAPKKSAAAASSNAASSTPAPTTAPTASSTVAKTSSNNPQSIDQVALNIVQHYQKTTPQRTKLIDAFMAFLVVVGGLQFAYCVLAGNYPFNAFLSGFSATVGQFVLTASLRIQTTEANKAAFPSVSPERYVVCRPTHTFSYPLP
ncbi:defender against death DAD protein [Hypoxylon sp. NC1633]|nr:defender against death DAD protein [Hypoxylon sp. NC1633]